ncbi:CCN family member 1 [Takifugu flavidus]|uniref:Protein CYR61 CCN family member 1 n=1 Tax=Takifugu flavidus TaxID=433684 RepID=A0A5C6N1K2_9TELE|nr:CCN family member 1 [Takifugu flavidus]TWW59537.1 Protein CYR61 CCN family member 1 [Takifugu flavidus]
MVFLAYLIALTTAIITQVMASCPAVCECPAETLSCPPGVSLVPDGCGCCKVCAAQLNQDCSSLRPCDHHKGLECNYGNDVTVAWGVCTANSDGRTCEYNGRIYQNGETFRAGCKHQCSCIDGAVGCAPLCTNKLPPASPSCPYPQLTRIPGQCCFSVDCHKGTWHLPPKYQAPPTRHMPKPRIQQLENGLDSSHMEVKSSGWEGERGYKHLSVWNHLKDRKCPVQTTEWTQCSRSCGMGISSRITNKNPQCKLERETRICTIRPCNGITFPSKRGKKCSQIHRVPEPVYLSYGECRSVRLYRPSHCGTCTDGRCCSPRRTRTVPVSFVCPDDERFQRSVMFIQSCKCSSDCSHLNEVALPPQYWMYGDTHMFTD